MSVAVLDRPSGLIATSSGSAGVEELEMGAHPIQTTSPALTERERNLYGNLLAAIAKAVEDETVVSTAALFRAREFIAAIPDSIRVPDIVTDDGGAAISFDWYISNAMVLSVHVDQRGVIGFAAMVNGVPESGQEPFVGAIPTRVSELLGAYQE